MLKSANGSVTKRSRAPKESDEVLVIVDEIGNLGKTAGGEGNGLFGFGISVLEDPEKYAAVSADYKKYKGIKGEFKALSVKKLREKMRISWMIRRSGAKNYGYYIDKGMDTPKGWMEQKGSDAQVGMLYLAIDLTLSKIRSNNVTVVVDDHTAYHTKDAPDRAELLSGPLSKKHGKNIVCMTSGKKNDPYSAHLQTADAVSHAIFEREEEGYPWMSVMMGQKLMRLTKEDDIYLK